MSVVSPKLEITRKKKMTPKQLKWAMAQIVTANAKKLEEAKKEDK